MSRLSGREQAVWDKRNAGLTFKQIAEELGLCPATVSFAYGKAYRKIEYGKAMKISKLTEYEVYKKALELTIKEIAILNNNNVCANKQCSDTSCDYYTETHNCLNMRKKYWLAQAEKELKGEK